MDSYIQLTFYPVGATAPALHLCASTGQYFLTYGHSSYLARAATNESANEAKSKSKIKMIRYRDPLIDEIGNPKT
jgi:hypothetical protein